MVEENDAVREQYTEYPYPPRDPEDEKNRLLKSSAGNLVFINNLFWKGKRIFNKDFRVLDAGCGTGDSTIFLAEQLKNTEADIVALDFSKNSLNIVKKRAEIRGLKRIKFVQDSILNIPKLGLGKFDYIISSGVLHHLESPEEGLKALSNVLKEDGGMIIMLYGKYGRTAVYMLQELLKRINKDEKSMKEKIKNAKQVLDSLPNLHWFHFSKNQFRELKKQTDAGIYDLLLHSHDKPYTVPEIYELVKSANLKILRFLENPLYDPLIFVKGELAKKIEKLPKIEQEAIAELFFGRMIKHTFFVIKENNTIPEVDPSNINLVPCFRAPIPKNLNENTNLSIKLASLKVNIKLNKSNIAILNSIDGKKSLKEVLELASKQTSISYEDLFTEWKKLYETIKHADFILLNLA